MQAIRCFFGKHSWILFAPTRIGATYRRQCEHCGYNEAWLEDAEAWVAEPYQWRPLRTLSMLFLVFLLIWAFLTFVMWGIFAAKQGARTPAEALPERTGSP